MALEQNQEARNWGMIAHLSSLVGFIIPFGNIIGPLIVWLVKKDEMPFVDEQGKESLNFQISVFIYAVISGILTLVVIGLLMLLALGIFWLVFAIIAGIKAGQGESYRYPLTIRLLK
ncbi:MAG: DUF4870 domain-containing protein [Cyanobacteria bacterium P01_D01_bin.128]